MTVFAPSSLSGPFTRIATDVEGIRKGLHVKFVYGDSITRTTAAVITTADERAMAALQKTGTLAKGYRVFARDRLEIVVAKGNAKKIKALRDLAQPGLVVAIPATTSHQAQSALKRAKATVQSEIVPNTRAALVAVETGQTAAAIVYTAAARSAATKVTAVEIPKRFNVLSRYAIAVTKNAEKSLDAKTFVRRVRSQNGKATLRDFGFQPV